MEDLCINDNKRQIEWEDKLESWVKEHYKDITNLFEQKVKEELILCLQRASITKIPGKEIYAWFQIQGYDLLDIDKCENCGRKFEYNTNENKPNTQRFIIAKIKLTYENNSPDINYYIAQVKLCCHKCKNIFAESNRSLDCNKFLYLKAKLIDLKTTWILLNNNSEMNYLPLRGSVFEGELKEEDDLFSLSLSSLR